MRIHSRPTKGFGGTPVASCSGNLLLGEQKGLGSRRVVVVALDVEEWSVWPLWVERRFADIDPLAPGFPHGSGGPCMNPCGRFWKK